MKSSSVSSIVKYLHFLDHFSTRFALIAKRARENFGSAKSSHELF